MATFQDGSQGNFEGHPTPFTAYAQDRSRSTPDHWMDAAGNPIDEALFTRWKTAAPAQTRGDDLSAQWRAGAKSVFGQEGRHDTPETEQWADAVALAATTTYKNALAAGKSEEEARALGEAAYQHETSAIAAHLKVPDTTKPVTGEASPVANPASPDAAAGNGAVTGGDKEDALKQYRDAIAKANAQYGDVLTHVPTPTPGMGVTKVKSVVDPTKTVLINGANLDPAMAARVNGASLDPSLAIETGRVGPISTATATAAKAEGTTLDEAQQAEIRKLQLANNADLQATVRGEGAGQAAAAARLKAALLQTSANASGLAAQARGADRASALRQAVLKGSDDALAAGFKIEELNAADRLAAQGQLTTSLQGTRATDVDIAAKKASLEQERKLLQAQLENAINGGNRDAENATRLKMADLEQRSNEADALARNTIQTTNLTNKQRAEEANAIAVNSDRQKQADLKQAAEKANQEAQNTAQARDDEQRYGAQVDNNKTGIEVSRLTEEQRIANERLKLDASKAATDAAQGLLNEDQRQQTLALAKKQAALAEQQFKAARTDADRAAAAADRDFWAKVIASVTQGAVSAVAASDERVKRNIAPVKKGDLAELAHAVRRSLSTFEYEGGAGPPGERAGVMAQALEKTRLGKAAVIDEGGMKKVNYALLATMMAAANVKARKGAA